ncbi:MBL fold metallo-hydrolase [Vreelandella sedimenti]|uniref:MBL fold metallo-hydrolase n=1 Tax=Vreelandella sedimenti TaxID=2729618 RepID=UPI0030DB61F7
MKSRWEKILGVLLLLVLTIGVAGYAYLQSPKFGAPPDQESLALFQQSPNYSDGIFHNLEPIPEITTESDSDRGWLDFFFTGDSGRAPSQALPTVKTNLHELEQSEDIIVWLGHSSFYVQVAGQRILIDPVLSQNASPIPFTIQAFEGTSIYTVEDIPDIDYVLISHDHWDHLDYPTVMALQDQIDNVIVGLGVGSHFRSWGFNNDQIIETDWNTQIRLDDELVIHVLPARHYSGRLFQRNQTLWVSFGIQSPQRQLYFSGDSGYGSHFQVIANTLGAVDVAMLDSGQYDEQWRFTHMMPEDAAQAGRDLRATGVIPAHVGRFSLAFHDWDDPFNQLAGLEQDKPFGLLTPRIGEVIELDSLSELDFTQWWDIDGTSDD